MRTESIHYSPYRRTSESVEKFFAALAAQDVVDALVALQWLTANADWLEHEAGDDTDSAERAAADWAAGMLEQCRAELGAHLAELRARLERGAVADLVLIERRRLAEVHAWARSYSALSDSSLVLADVMRHRGAWPSSRSTRKLVAGFESESKRLADTGRTPSIAVAARIDSSTLAYRNISTSRFWLEAAAGIFPAEHAGATSIVLVPATIARRIERAHHAREAHNREAGWPVLGPCDEADFGRHAEVFLALWEPTRAGSILAVESAAWRATKALCP